MKCQECENRAYFLQPRRWCEYHWRTWYYQDYSIEDLERVLELDAETLTEEHEQAILELLTKLINSEEPLSIDDIDQ